METQGDTILHKREFFKRTSGTKRTVYDCAQEKDVPNWEYADCSGPAFRETPPLFGPEANDRLGALALIAKKRSEGSATLLSTDLSQRRVFRRK